MPPRGTLDREWPLVNIISKYRRWHRLRLHQIIEGHRHGLGQPQIPLVHVSYDYSNAPKLNFTAVPWRLLIGSEREAESRVVGQDLGQLGAENAHL